MKTNFLQFVTAAALIVIVSGPAKASTEGRADAEVCTSPCARGPLSEIQLLRMSPTTVRVAATLGQPVGQQVVTTNLVDVTGLRLSVDGSTAEQGKGWTTPPGPLTFTLGRPGGLKIADLASNSGRFFYVAEIRVEDRALDTFAAIADGGSESPVPEPLTVALTGAGLLAMGWMGRRLTNSLKAQGLVSH